MHYEFWYYNSRVGKYRNCQIMPCYLLLYLEGLIRIQYTYRCSQKLNFNSKHQSVSSVAQSCQILRDPMNRSITNCRSLPKPMSIESVMPSNHLILRRPLLLLPSIFPSIRVFSNESALHIRWPKDWSFSFSISPISPDSLL